MVVILDNRAEEVEYGVGRVIRSSTDGSALNHKLQMYTADASGSWSPASGKGSKRTFPRSSILLVGLHLTPKKQKITKQDHVKLDAAIAKL